MTKFENAITSKTKAVIINTPNNPTGVIYSEETIKNIAEILNKKQKEFNSQIYLISDEPYREIVYDDVNVPYVTKYYNNTIIVYSYSKSLSLPGERIGYVLIPDELEESNDMIQAVSISNRIIGCVNAPSLIQRVIPYCLDAKVNVDAYKKNRDLLYSIIVDNNFECIKPQGAFYLFVKTPIDDKEFCNIAKKYNILVVPGSSFACPGYVRMAYCVSYEMIQNSRKVFEQLSKELNLI